MRRVLLLTVMALTVVAVGCGGDGDGGDRADSAPTFESWAAEVNAVCRDIIEEAASLEQPTSAEGLLANYEQVVQLFDEEIRRFADIEAPPEIADEVAQQVSLMEADQIDAERAVDFLESGNQQAAQEAFDGFTSDQDELQAFRDKYELDDCQNGVQQVAAAANGTTVPAADTTATTGG